MGYGGDMFSLVAMFGAYVAVIVVAIYYESFTPSTVASLIEAEPFYQTMWKDILCTVVIWMFSFCFGNSSFYDAYWSVIPPLIVYDWCSFKAQNVEPLGMWTPRMIACTIVVNLWGSVTEAD